MKNYVGQTFNSATGEGDVLYLDGDYCECASGFIHKKMKERHTCAECGAREVDQPDSRHSEVLEIGGFSTIKREGS